MTQRMIEIDSPNFIPAEQLQSASDLQRRFGNRRPLALEIGCGIGDFIVELAAREPQTNFLAIDIYNRGCYKTCRKLDLHQLSNVRVMRIEARHLMTRFLERDSLQALYINCPDPWPKKRHRRRRLVNREFLQLACRVLQPGGDLYFSTDFTDYAHQTAELLESQAGFCNCLPRALVHELPGYPKSKYMKRFLRQGQPLHYLHHRKREDLPPEAIPLPDLRAGFRMPCNRVENE